MQIKYKISLLLFITILMACNTDIVFKAKTEIDNTIWETDNIISYQFSIDDTAKPYNIYIDFHHRDLYPYRNIWMFVSTISENGIAQRDTVEFFLANESGEWYDTGFLNNGNHQLLYKRNVGFPAKGLYRVEIQHGMRKRSLPEVKEIGVIVEESEVIE